MVPSIPPLPYRKVDQILRTSGFEPVSQRGSHGKYTGPNGRTVIVLFHADRDIGRGLLRRIARDADLDPDLFRT